MRQCCKLSGSVWTDTLQCSFDISCSESCSGLCQCSFSTALVWMMRFSSLRSLAWKVQCSAAWRCSQKMSSPSILCSRTGINYWPLMKYCTAKKEELWHLCCHTLHLRPCGALGPILLWNWTNWCLEMHPADVLKHSEPFVSILQDIYRTYVFPQEIGFLAAPCYWLVGLCVYPVTSTCTKNMFKARDNSHC